MRADTGPGARVGSLTSQQQRFCPLCDRAFADGEAVLRCDGCGVMHHPGCWVKHGGCATPREHASNAIALAYETNGRSSSQAPHPGEGTRVRVPPLGSIPSEAPDDEPGELPGRAPVPIAPRMALQQRPPAPPDPVAPPPAVGGDDLLLRQRAPYNPEPTAPPEERRRRPGRRPPAGHHPQKPLPSVYRHHRILRYWYIPAAAAVALGVALGIIWMVDQVTGDGDKKGSTGGSVPATTATAQVTAATTAAAGSPTPKTTATGSPTATPGSGTSQKFKPGDVAVVVGTGDCLNVRVAAGRSNDAIICLADGEQVSVTGGPEAKDGLQWWKVKTKSGEGWAAEDYLAKKP